MNLFMIADEWEPLIGLREFLETLGHKVEAFTDLPPFRSFTAFDAGFMYFHRTMNAELERGLVDYVHHGGRLVALHHGLASAKVHNPAWMELAGLHIEPRDARCHPWRVISGVTHWLVNLCPGHYITTHYVEYDRSVRYTSSDAPSLPGMFPALELPHTEVFVNQHFTGGRSRTVLFGSMCRDPDSGAMIMQDRGGWLRPAGAGVLIYLQPGHAPADFAHAGFLQVLSNCLTWDGQS